MRRVPLEDAVETIIDHRGRTPKKLGGDFTDRGVQVISAKNVSEGRLNADDNQRFVTPEMAARWMPNPLRPHDVLLTSEAPLGQVAFLGEHADYCLGQRLFALRAKPGVTHPRFLYYLLRSPVVQTRLHARASGTTAQGIKQSELRQVMVDLPDLDEQVTIASTLGVLDDKIDSNRRVVDLLDATVSQLYRGLFVDFIHHAERADSPLGAVPVGWPIAHLGDLGTVRGGGTPSSKIAEYWNPAEITWVTPKDMTSLRSPVVAHSERRISEAGLKSSSAKLLPAGTVLYTSRATLGHVAVAQRELATNQGFITIEPAPEFSSAFVLMTLRHRNDAIIAKANGSTFLEVNKTNFRTVPFVRPPDAMLGAFDRVAGPAFAHIAHLDAESAFLLEIREALLRRLLTSGSFANGTTGNHVTGGVEDLVRA